MSVGLDVKTRLLGIFGNPLKHSCSPAMHNEAFAALKLNCIYLPFEIRTDELEEAVGSLRALNFFGVNVTIPYKRDVIPLLDGISGEARLIGAVNTIKVEGRRLVGHNTDGRGFVNALSEEAGVHLKGKRVFVIGAGGAGRAVAVQSALEGACAVCIADCQENRAQELAAHIHKKFPDCESVSVPVRNESSAAALQEADVVVNASPLGMQPSDPMPVDPAWFSKKAVVFDLVYNPSETKLVRAARRRGCKAYNGLEMLLFQGVHAFELWMGRKAPVEVMRRALKKAVGS